MLSFIIEYWLQIGFGFLVTAITSMIRNIKITTNKLQSLQNGLKSLIRCRIIDSYSKVIDNDYIRLSDKEVLVEIYKEYKNLGGNGVVDDMMREINFMEVYTGKEGKVNGNARYFNDG